MLKVTTSQCHGKALCPTPVTCHFSSPREDAQACRGDPGTSGPSAPPLAIPGPQLRVTGWARPVREPTARERTARGAMRLNSQPGQHIPAGLPPCHPQTPPCAPAHSAHCLPQTLGAASAPGLRHRPTPFPHPVPRWGSTSRSTPVPGPSPERHPWHLPWNQARTRAGR